MERKIRLPTMSRFYSSMLKNTPIKSCLNFLYNKPLSLIARSKVRNLSFLSLYSYPLPTPLCHSRAFRIKSINRTFFKLNKSINYSSSKWLILAKILKFVSRILLSNLERRRNTQPDIARHCTRCGIPRREKSDPPAVNRDMQIDERIGPQTCRQPFRLFLRRFNLRCVHSTLRFCDKIGGDVDIVEMNSSEYRFLVRLFGMEISNFSIETFVRSAFNFFEIKRLVSWIWCFFGYNIV